MYLVCFFTEHSIYDYKFSRFYLLISFFHTILKLSQWKAVTSMNRLIRRWLPKGTKKTTPKEVAFIENWINNYPKKCLDCKSPRKDCLLANLKFSDSVLARKDRWFIVINLDELLQKRYNKKVENWFSINLAQRIGGAASHLS